jgi:hypothetical protein
MKSSYRHTQISMVMALLLVALLFLVIALVVTTHYGVQAMVGYIVVAVILANYLSLTVEVKPEKVEMRFGLGMVRRSIALEEIQNLCVVETTPQEGLGWRLTETGWLYNIAGREAVEIILRDDSQVRIGSDEPVELARAIENALIEMRKTPASRRTLEGR